MGSIRTKRPNATTARRAARRPKHPGPKTVAHARLVMEPLEPRRVLDAGPLVVSELMAINESVHPDGDGDYSDWIEIHNPTDARVDLGGWYLTDDATDLMKWQFPGGQVDAGGYLVVFASGKDPNGPAGQWHTNFQLDGDGEYLALVRPDGETVSHQFAPEFPEQFEDVSYGTSQDATAFTLSGEGLTYRVPTAGDAALGTAWTAPGFNDSAWSGFALPPRVLITEACTGSWDYAEIQNLSGAVVDTSGWVVAANDATGDVPDINTVHATLWTLPDSIGADDVLYRTDNPDDPSHYWNENIFWRTSGPGWVMLVDDAGNVVDFVVWGYGSEQITSLAVTINGFDVTADGSWIGESVGVNQISDASLQRSGVNDHDDLSDWTFVAPTSQGVQNEGLTVPFSGRGAPGIGFELSPPGLEGVIQMDVADAMHGRNASLWTRIPFVVDNPGVLDTMALRMRYNDGFAAYINGREVARRNAPDLLAFDAAAPDGRSVAETLVAEEIELTDARDALVAGTNVLAIHGLNAAATDANFLVLPELVVTSARYFVEPTPGLPNGAGILGFVGDTAFSVDRGFYQNPFFLAITTDTPGTSIYYTLDGSDPTEETGIRYDGHVYISRTTTVRAAAFRSGYQPSNIDTHTYLFLSDVVRQSPNGEAAAGWPTGPINGQVLDYGMDPNIVNDSTWGPQLAEALTAIPTMSIVTDLDNLLDPATGIYTHPREDGDFWERPTSMELIYPPGAEGPGFPDGADEGFQIDAGLRIRGGYSRSTSNPKHAFRLFFRNEYGDGKLNYPLFGDEGTDSFDKVDLRTAQNYSWSFDGGSANAMCRDVFVRDTQGLTGNAYTRSRYYHLYINGQYWGLYQTQERSEAAYGSSYFGGERENWDTVKVTTDGYVIHATDGSLAAWQDAWNQARAGLGTDAAYYRIQGLNPDGTRNPAYPVLIDIDNLIDYMIIVLYDGDRDAPISNFLSNTSPNNWYGIRDRTGEEGFRFFCHDSEHTLSRGLTNRNGPYPAGDTFNKSNPQWIHQELMAHPEYRLRFADHVQKHFFNGGILTPQEASSRFRARAAQIEMAIIAESARWGDARREPPRTKNDWLGAINNEVNSWFPGRTQTVLSQFPNTVLRNGTPAPLYPDVAAPDYSRHGGEVASGDRLSISAPSGDIYYTLDGSDPRLPGGALSPSARLFQGSSSTTGLIDVDDSWAYDQSGNDLRTAWREPGFDDSSWSIGDALLYVETSSLPAPTNTPLTLGPITYYFRRHFTLHADPQDISLQLSTVIDDGAVVYINGQEAFTLGMPAGEIDYQTRAGRGVGNALYEGPFTIPTDALVPGDNVIAVEVHQTSSTSTDVVFGLTLDAVVDTTSNPITLVDSTLVKSRALEDGQWSALTEAQFYVGPFASAESLVISELNYNPYAPAAAEEAAGYTDNDDFEFIELGNVGSETIDLTGVEFVDGIAFTFGSQAKSAPLVQADFDSGADGFVYADDVFNATAAPDLAEGTLEATGGVSGGGLRVQLGPHITYLATSGGWSRNFSLARADTVHVSLQFRMVLGEGLETAEYGQTILEIDGVRYGSDVDNSLVHQAGDGNGGGDDDTGWLSASFSVPLSAGDHAITIGAYNNRATSADEFVEVFFDNLSIATSLNPMRLAPGQRVVIGRSEAALALRYGTAGMVVAGTYDGKLDNAGERIELVDRSGSAIVAFEYNDTGDWPGRADGKGASLELIDPAGVPPDEPQRTAYLEDGDNWRSSSEYGGSPGIAGEGPQDDVLVNEVLSHTDWPVVDTIELFNASDAAIDLGGWYLSDSGTDYRKFRIPDGTTLAAGGYVVFDEDDFNPTPESPGPNDFALDGAHGDDVWLLEADAADRLTRFVDHVDFGPAANGESFGRWPNGSGDLAPMRWTTLNPVAGENSGPRVGPVVISEMMYHPDASEGADDLEYIEIFNPGREAVDLTHWRLDNGVAFDFAASTVLEPQAALVVVAFDPGDAEKLAAFRDQYGIDESVRLVGGYTGQLNDDGERVQLQRPDAPPPDEPGFVPRLVEDEVRYGDQPPWPVEADGGGQSLRRAAVDLWGNDGLNWLPADPTPGSVLTACPSVVHRAIFYNHSAFDGNDAAADARDDEAIAIDKQALLPGETATAANYTGYSRGINGIMVDLAGAGAVDAADFQFRVGNTNDPSTWPPAPDPIGTWVRSGDGLGGSDRVTIVWDDFAITKQWLQVTVLATPDTGLCSADVFYFGNAVGDACNATGDARVNATDMLLARNNPRSFLNPAPIDFPYDFNRDARVNATDMLLARNNQTHFLNALNLIAPSEAKPGEEVAAAAASAASADGLSAPYDWVYRYEDLSVPNHQSKQSDADTDLWAMLLAAEGDS
ncbi:MAG: lamin tail domain-containing protein [Pirellulales bacterium]|nr:lamin tail domain-containing protein [Pirellulales bacterium]